MPQAGDRILLLTAQIVIAQMEHNDTPPDTLPGLIRDVYRALASAAASTVPHSDKSTSSPAAVRKTAGGQTVFDDHLICLECGGHMKMLKRHLQTFHNTTPAQYRAKFQLPADYPMVARHYALLRSSLAKESGLGKRPVARRSR
jgi:MucR family transcriptional regulator, transcriptional regulator of exopolysaccharide biosynthesis